MLDQKIDAFRYRATLGPVAERISRSHTTREALGLAESFLGDNASVLGADIQPPFREEAAYLWSTFPTRVKSLGKYQEMLNVLLEQVIDTIWYGTYPPYQSDADVQQDDTLVTFKIGRAHV